MAFIIVFFLPFSFFALKEICFIQSVLPIGIPVMKELLSVMIFTGHEMFLNGTRERERIN